VLFSAFLVQDATRCDSVRRGWGQRARGAAQAAQRVGFCWVLPGGTGVPGLSALPGAGWVLLEALRGCRAAESGADASPRPAAGGSRELGAASPAALKGGGKAPGHQASL